MTNALLLYKNIYYLNIFKIIKKYIKFKYYTYYFCLIYKNFLNLVFLLTNFKTK